MKSPLGILIKVCKYIYMYEQTMQQLAYVESEMCYFASVDVRHLMRFCLHDKEGF